MEMVLFVLKVNQYFPPLTCQINSGSISKLIIWQYLSLTGSAKFEDKIREKYIDLLMLKKLFNYFNFLSS